MFVIIQTTYKPLRLISHTFSSKFLYSWNAYHYFLIATSCFLMSENRVSWLVYACICACLYYDCSAYYALNSMVAILCVLEQALGRFLLGWGAGIQENTLCMILKLSSTALIEKGKMWWAKSISRQPLTANPWLDINLVLCFSHKNACGSLQLWLGKLHCHVIKRCPLLCRLSTRSISHNIIITDEW